MVEIFKALGDEIRLRIVSLLLKDTLCVCEIEKVLKLTQSNASRHLSVLKGAKIVESYKVAQWTYYKIKDNFVTNNSELYKYLESNLIGLPSYNKDIAELERCKQINLCNKTI
jgi:ArsR family transcriptional regulator